MTDEDTEEEEDDAEEEEREEISKLRGSMDIIATTDPSGLVRERALGAANFAEYVPLFDEVIQYVADLIPLPWEIVTDAQASRVNTSLDGLITSLRAIGDMSIDTPNLTTQRDALANQLSSQFDALKTETMPIAGYLSFRTLDLEVFRRDMAGLQETLTAETSALVQEIREKNSEAETTLAAIRTVSAEAGVAHHSEVFAAAAKKHAESATRWLRAAIGTGLVTIAAVFALVLAWDTNGDLSDASVAQVVVAKGVLLLVGLLAVLTCVRLFRSNSHLAIVNREREDSLKTFRAFVEAAGDDAEVKNAVLLESTHAIFRPSATGLIDGKEGPESLDVLDAAGGLLLRRK